jgi:hypothetical protein
VWTTEDAVRQRVANKLNKDPSLPNTDHRGLVAKWDTIIPAAITRAEVDFRNLLVGRGFTSAQLDQWDDRAQYSEDQSFYYSITDGASQDEVADSVKRYDRVSMLMKVPAETPLTLMIGGTLTAPGGQGGAAAVGGGSINLAPDGVNYGTMFGLRVNRQNGRNQYGDEIKDRW